MLASLAPRGHAQTETVLYRFCSMPNCSDGTEPVAGLLIDTQGDIYGAALGGPNGFTAGMVFEITPSKESVVYGFNSVAGGQGPNGGFVRDTNGNFYGTTERGGYDKRPCKQSFGCGVVFELSPSGTENVLYTFTGGPDGSSPNGGLVFDGKGNLYGTTYGGGAGNRRKKAGTVFQLSSTGIETVLHRFGAYKGDGQFPSTGLVMDAKGNLYGTTNAGGFDGYYDGAGHDFCVRGCGTVFEINTSGVETTFYTFKGWKNKDGAEPIAGLILDAKGNFYGTTAWGGLYGFGTVFELTSAGKEKILYSFTGTTDGAIPVGGLVMDSKGNLFGTTYEGGAFGFGTVFELTPNGKETVLYSFADGPDGAYPFDAPVMDAKGNLYGTTYLGGNFNSDCPQGCGVLFKVSR